MMPNYPDCQYTVWLRFMKPMQAGQWSSPVKPRGKAGEAGVRCTYGHIRWAIDVGCRQGAEDGDEGECDSTVYVELEGGGCSWGRGEGFIRHAGYC
jgi:hypothetical protein